MACRTACQMLQRRLASSAATSVRLSAAELRSRRSSLFSQELARQRALYPRIEKIEVQMEGPGLQGTLMVMNKGVSTPHSCARHLSEWHVNRAVLALVDGEAWPLHKPLTRSCSLTLLTFRDTNPLLANQAYWRSCAALLGQVLQNAFKDDFSVEILKIPEVPVTSGAFCCDVVLDPQLDSWTPTEEALRSFTRDSQQLTLRDLPWEPLEVAPSVALDMFANSSDLKQQGCRLIHTGFLLKENDNSGFTTTSGSKQAEVEELAAQSPSGTVSLYRCGDHVTLSGGPLVARTGLCVQYEVTALHSLGQGAWGLHRRAQGLSLPEHQQAHHTVWKKLRKRAEKLVTVTTPSASQTTVETTAPPSDSSHPQSPAPTNQ